MMQSTDKSDLQAWMARWKIVNDFEREELRRTPIDTKVRQLAAMMRMARALGWDAESQGEVDHVRSLWVRLKKKATCDGR